MAYGFHQRPMSEVEDWLTQEAVVDGVGQYMESTLQPILVQGLTILAKEKPCAHPVEALSFLGRWLLDNNPNKVAHLHSCHCC